MRITSSLTALIVLLTLVSITGCGVKNTNKIGAAKNYSGPAAGMRTVTSDKGYKIDIPTEWVNKKGDGVNMDLQFNRPKMEGETFLVNGGVVEENIPRGMSIKRYNDISIKKFQERGLTSTINSSAPFIGNLSGMKDKITIIIKGNIVKESLYLFVTETKAYVIVCVSSAENFAKDEIIFDQIATSFR